MESRYLVSYGENDFAGEFGRRDAAQPSAPHWVTIIRDGRVFILSDFCRMARYESHYAKAESGESEKRKLTGKMPVPLWRNHFLQNEPNFCKKQIFHNWLPTRMLHRSCSAKVSVFFTQNEPNF
jgi:hypothetical protein